MDVSDKGVNPELKANVLSEYSVKVVLISPFSLLWPSALGRNLLLNGEETEFSRIF